MDGIALQLALPREISFCMAWFMMIKICNFLTVLLFRFLIRQCSLIVDAICAVTFKGSPFVSTRDKICGYVWVCVTEASEDKW